MFDQMASQGSAFFHGVLKPFKMSSLVIIFFSHPKSLTACGDLGATGSVPGMNVPEQWPELVPATIQLPPTEERIAPPKRPVTSSSFPAMLI